MTEPLYDVAIIGAGLTGLFSAFYAGMRNLKTVVLEGLERPGGQLSALYPEKLIYDVGGYPTILARDLVNELWKQASQFGATFRFNEPVTLFEQIELGYNRLTTPQRLYYAKTVVVAAGIGAFEPRKLDGIPGISEFERRGVEYIAQPIESYRGKRLMVVGGGDTAVDWAVALASVARSMVIIHRFDYFEAHERSVMALASSTARVFTEHKLRRVEGKNHLTHAVIFSRGTQHEHILKVDELLICIGFKATMGPIEAWGLPVTNKAIRVNGKMESGLPGIYAAGDITFPTDAPKMNFIANGFGQATVAVNLATTFIYPKLRVFPGHSSQKMQKALEITRTGSG